jgi:hypothetical protein
MTLLAEAVSRLDGKAELTADDALAVRRIIFGSDDAVDREEAEALIRLNRDAARLSEEWRLLFVEGLTDYVVHQHIPAGWVDEAKADWLMKALGHDPRGKDDELDVLVHVLDRAESTPAGLTAFTLGRIRSAILDRREAGVTKVDVERLRQTLYAVGGASNIAVTRDEAGVLFDLNDDMRNMPNDPAWSDLFVRAVANAVLYAPTYQAPSAEAELHTEAWLADTSIHPLRNLENAVMHPRTTFGLRGVDTNLRRVEADHYRADEALEAEAAKVTADEGHWLVGRMGRDGVFDANEKALVAFLAENASQLDPDLRDAVERLSGRAAA